MENQQANNLGNITSQESAPYKENQETYTATTEVIPSAQEKKWLVPVLILLLIVTLASTAFFAYQNMQLKKQSDSTTTAVFSPSPTSQLPLPSSSPANQFATTNDFTYQNFKITYPNDWIFSDVLSSNTFPLKERLQPLYGQGKVIALSKDGIYLIITIEKASEGEAGGIFTSDQEYQQFLTDRDRVAIGGSTFYINKSHADIASLAESHAGPWLWGSVTEYIPSKITKSGNVFKGYESIIKRGNYVYNFIVVSNTGGLTENELQREIISMLETIQW